MAENPDMSRLLSIVLLVLGASPIIAQQPAAAGSSSPAAKPSSAKPSSDFDKTAAAIRGSYYHPDDLASIDCDVSLDWSAMLSALKAAPAPERLKALEAIKIRSHAVRGKTPELTFEWPTESLEGKDSIENGLKQTLGGYYQSYWAMIASPPIGEGSEISKIEPLPDGEANVYTSAKDINLVVKIDKESTPKHYEIDSPAMKGTIDLQHISSLKPVTGDLRRISKVDISQHVGTSTMNIVMSLDYQAVGEYFVPKHVAFDIPGAYSLAMDFSGCSASKEGKVGN